MPITLTTIPEAGADLERFVSALFQANGYYVEKNLIERAPTDILELDAVATSYEAGTSSSILVEAKGGGWGWSDLFKILGWTTYLHFPRAVLCAVNGNGKPLETIEAKLGPHGVSVVCFGDFAAAAQQFVEAGLAASPADAEILSLWRYSYSLETTLTDRCVNLSKEPAPTTASGEIVNYMKLINDGTFFAEDVPTRVAMLYNAYKDHPRLALATALELEGQPFDPSPPLTPSQMLNAAFLGNGHALIQGAMYAEHRGRLALLKAAIDYAIEIGQGQPAPIVDPLVDAPQSFKAGIEWLQAQPTFHRYAIFWQQFLWGWGGFYLTHISDQEFAWMAQHSGVPIAEVPTALEAFDRLFPMPSSWLVTPGPTSARVVRMVPTAFRGIGAHHRRQTYEWQGANPYHQVGGAQHTGNDLVRFNNAAYALLSGQQV